MLRNFMKKTKAFSSRPICCRCVASLYTRRHAFSLTCGEASDAWPKSSLCCSSCCSRALAREAGEPSLVIGEPSLIARIGQARKDGGSEIVNTRTLKLIKAY